MRSDWIFRVTHEKVLNMYRSKEILTYTLLAVMVLGGGETEKRR